MHPSSAPSQAQSNSKAKGCFGRQGHKFRHKIDTTVISLSLKVLKEDLELAAWVHFSALNAKLCLIYISNWVTGK
jgi:hypothetical protein